MCLGCEQGSAQPVGLHTRMQAPGHPGKKIRVVVSVADLGTTELWDGVDPPPKG